MSTRRRALPPGWYPADEGGVTAFVETWREGLMSGSARAVIAPHAGWAFSGRLAVRAIASLRPAETIVVVGGHLPAEAPVLCAPERYVETPLGALEADEELREALARRILLATDHSSDNTVEVQLPIVRALFPQARLLWLRAPAGREAVRLGTTLAAAAAEVERSLACIGSTDLTHYGPDYGFTPAGRGRAAAAWVRETSDKGFIDALIAMDPGLVLERGEAGAACSAGAAAAAIAFAEAMGAHHAELLGYATSLETRESESFVGYCAVAFS